LIQGGEGCGKSTLAEILRAVLGRRNISKLNATDVMNSQFNDWAYGSQLVVMEEVRMMGHNRYAVMDTMKPCISDDFIGLNCKFEPKRTVPNVTNYLSSS
jgi:energy-coupling factor transporter ATP-binding protein EcfA2